MTQMTKFRVYGFKTGFLRDTVFVDKLLMESPLVPSSDPLARALPRSSRRFQVLRRPLLVRLQTSMFVGTCVGSMPCERVVPCLRSMSAESIELAVATIVLFRWVAPLRVQQPLIH